MHYNRMRRYIYAILTVTNRSGSRICGHYRKQWCSP